MRLSSLLPAGPVAARLARASGQARAMLTLYYAAHTCSLATHIVLEEVGADYSTVRVDFGSSAAALAGISEGQSQGAACRRWRPIAAS